MKSTILLLLGIMFSEFSNSQNLQTKVKLDTIINTQIDLSNEYEKVNACIYNNVLWFNIPTWDDDSLKFVRLDLQTYKIDTVFGVVPSLIYKVKFPISQCITVNDKYCVVKFFESIAVFDVVNEKLKYNNIFPTVEHYSYLKLNGSKLFCAQAYNHSPLDQVNKVSLIIYDLKGQDVLSDINPEIKNIEFSHFSNYHWIDATERQILVAQTTDYSIDIYDYELKKTSSLIRVPDNWKKFDNNIMVRLRKKTDPSHPKQLIDSLLPLNDYYSRLEAAYFINDTTIYTRYIPFMQKEAKRLVDFWVYRNGEWLLKEKDLIDEKPGKREIMNKRNCFIMSTYYRNCFDTDNLVILEPGTTDEPFGKTYTNFFESEDDYFSDHAKPLLKIYCYKFIK
jgi:hypothetical protein